MRIFENHYHRLPARQSFELADQRIQRPLLLPPWAEVRQWMALRTRQRHKIGEKCHVLRRGGKSQHGLEFFQPGRGWIVAREP